jgi:hypothetical protein
MRSRRAFCARIAPLLVDREGRPLDAALLRRSDRSRRVAVKPPAERCPLEEPFEHADVLRPCPSGAVAPEVVYELLKSLRSHWRLEVGKLEVGEVARQLVQARLVGLVSVRQQSPAVLAQVGACLLAKRERPVRLVLHGLALYAGRDLERL